MQKMSPSRSVIDLVWADVHRQSLETFVASLLIFTVVFVRRDANTTFLSIVALVLFAVMYVSSKQRQKNDVNDRSGFLDEVESKLQGTEFSEGALFAFHKNPKRLTYIRDKTASTLSDMLYDMRFIIAYDSDLFNRVVILLETFLRVHYNVMLDRYDTALYLPVLHDLRRTIANRMHTMIFVIPKVSTIAVVRGDNLDKFLIQQIDVLNSVTARYMKMVYNKFQHKHLGTDFTSYPIGITSDDLAYIHELY